MATNARAPLEDRLDSLALLFDAAAWDVAMTHEQLRAFVGDHASTLAELGMQVRTEYVRTDSVGDNHSATEGKPHHASRTNAHRDVS